MFSRAYKFGVTLPPLLWAALFLLVPYALMFSYSFWSVSPAQTIIHSWNLSNYRDLLFMTFIVKRYCALPGSPHA